MKTRIIAVRHAQSEGNLLAEFHGHYNSDITELGVVQAECTAKLLKDVHIDVAIASDIERAYHTACIIAEKHDGLEVVKDMGFREIKAGEWERMTFLDIEKNYPKEHHAWTHDLSNFGCPGGETVRELSARINKAFEKVARENAGKTVLVGTHATPLRCMGCIWQKKPLEKILTLPWVPNASVSVVDYDSETLEFELLTYAYSEHLEKDGLYTALPLCQ